MDFGYTINESFSSVSGSSWWLGAFIYVLGSITINFGSNLVKRDHSNMEKFEIKPPLYRRYLWIIGFSIFGLGNAFNFIAFMFAAQSLLSALGSIQFVSNLFFAYFINGERITKRSLVATMFIMAGNTLVVIFGSKSNTNNDIDELFHLLIQPPFLLYLAIISILVILFQTLYMLFDFQMKHIIEPNQPPCWMIRYQPLAYALVSAIIGTNTIIMGKAVAGLVENILEGELSTFTSLGTYVLLFVYVSLNIFWLYRLNSALRLYDAMFIIPVLQCIWLIFGVVGGGIFYQEFLKFTLLQTIFFVIGMGLLVIGILILRPNTPATSKNQVLPYDRIAKITAKIEIEIELKDLSSTSSTSSTSSSKCNNTNNSTNNTNNENLTSCDNNNTTTNGEDNSNCTDNNSNSNNSDSSNLTSNFKPIIHNN